MRHGPPGTSFAGLASGRPACRPLLIRPGCHLRRSGGTSFDHWADQRAGLAQCARVLAPGGCLVLADLFSVLLLPTLLAGRRGKARTKRQATQLVTMAGLHSPQWHHLYAVIIQAVTAIK